ncbi:MAG: hypothetical protein JM58_12685 [Peptococcaceae bacterium BICA1-8]|nr:MAG: hypothetical protein JM58_12685 [Peptococcaceae bacterium BICA1-8]
MHIIYNCYGGSHSSVTAASIHVGILKDNVIPNGCQLLNLPYYDKQVAKDHGFIRYIGEDEYRNKIYITSKHNLGRNYETIMRSLVCIMDLSNEKLVFVDTMPYVNWLMVIGGFLSRRLGIVSLGRPIVIKGTQISFLKFTQLVNIIKIKYGRYELECQ